MVKFRTMTSAHGTDGQLLPDADRLTAFGRFLRASISAASEATMSKFDRVEKILTLGIKWQKLPQKGAS